MSADSKTIEAELVEFVQTRGQTHATVKPATDLLESGLLDSLLLMDLVFHVEEAYRIRFESDEINPANFRTITAIAKLVLARSAQSRWGE